MFKVSSAVSISDFLTPEPVLSLCSLPSLPKTGVRKVAQKYPACVALGQRKDIQPQKQNQSRKTIAINCISCRWVGKWGRGKGLQILDLLSASSLTYPVSLLPFQNEVGEPNLPSSMRGPKGKTYVELFANSEF